MKVELHDVRGLMRLVHGTKCTILEIRSMTTMIESLLCYVSA